MNNCKGGSSLCFYLEQLWARLGFLQTCFHKAPCKCKDLRRTLSLCWCAGCNSLCQTERAGTAHVHPLFLQSWSPSTANRSFPFSRSYCFTTTTTTTVCHRWAKRRWKEWKKKDGGSYPPLSLLQMMRDVLHCNGLHLHGRTAWEPTSVRTSVTSHWAPTGETHHRC